MQPVVNKFEQTILTPAEDLQARQFTDLQLAFLRNEYCARRDQRLGMTFDPLTAHEFIQQEAYLKGQMELIDFLLTVPEMEEVPPQQ
jgi:hypothetical protein